MYFCAHTKSIGATKVMEKRMKAQRAVTVVESGARRYTAAVHRDAVMQIQRLVEMVSDRAIIISNLDNTLKRIPPYLQARFEDRIQHKRQYRKQNQGKYGDIGRKSRC